jgi:hypothetical protein
LVKEQNNEITHESLRELIEPPLFYSLWNYYLQTNSILSGQPREKRDLL